ncbi:MAG: hypothetical protein NC213_01550 [Acetobacter sp.]|nr:hypothetical protein [Bacteroides sp.]MCM1340412.1 hypothetical protein [Acetobacter sp.]MCM1432941.1 hypothetical protein [Clostridiales bacterium]
MMKTKARKFSHKLLALFMAIVMGITCFSGTFSAFAASSDVKYHEDAVEYNSLAWKVLSDEQVATALLDYADEMLAEFGPTIDNLIAGVLPSSGIYYYNKSARTFNLDVTIIKASVKVYTHSVDELMETLESVQSLLNSYGGLVGTLGKLNLDSIKGMRRSNTSSCDIIKGVLGILQKNFSSYNGEDPIGDILRGDFTLGTLGTFVKLDLYGLIGDMLGMNDGYESNILYNIAQQLIFDNGKVAATGEKWYSDEDIAAYKNGTKTWVYDEQLLDILTTKLLDRISALITYNETEIHELDENGEDVLDANGESIVLVPRDTSATRYAEIKEVMDAEGKTYAQAAAKLGYDPNIIYSDEFKSKDGLYQNVLLFAYGSPDENGLATDKTSMIKLSAKDSLFGFGLQALQMAWNTALKDSVKLVHVNFDRDKGHGSNFDNTYYYWMYAQDKWTGDAAQDYSAANVEAWMNAAYENYGASSMEEFKSWVLDNVSYENRGVAEDAKGDWSDIDSTSLFNKFRYSPLADYYFNIQTGPANLYFMQMGTPNLDAVFEEVINGKYSSLVAGLNDVLVAAVKDIFVDSKNVEGSLPQLAETDDLATINSSSIATISSTLVNNTLAMVQYVADAVDKNILNGFYIKYGANAKLTETNIEEAMIPMLIACIGQVNLGSGKLCRVIHPEDWNACQDAEAVAFLALREYLSYVLADKDYNKLVNITEDSITAAKGDMLNNVILPMARDAVSYVMQGYVPVADKSGAAWNVYEREVDDSATLLELLNSVICYYGGEYSFKNNNVPKSVGAMGVGALLGACDDNGKSLISTSNDIWTNIDLVANKILPLLGQLQYNDVNKKGQFSSKDLIWNDIVLGVLDIGDSSIHSSGQCGVTNFINRLLTIISSDPIQKTPVINTVYNFLEDLINGMFGARYTSKGQTYTEVFPANTGAHPFDDLAQKAALFGSKNGEAGALHKLVDNFVEFFGYGNSGVNTYPDSMIRGAMFALQALNSFMPNVMPSIGNHTLEMPTSKFANSTVTGASSGTTYTSDVTLKNNCTGVNDAYVDGMNDTVEQFGRYYVKVTGAKTSSTNGASITLTKTSSDYLAPGESFTTSATSSYAGADGAYRIDFTFAIYMDTNGTKTLIKDGLTSTCYQYITKNISWEDTVYPASRNGQINDAGLETDNADSTMTLNGFRTFTSSTFLNGDKTNVLYPEYFVLDNQNLGAISGYQVRFRNNQNADKGMDGIYYFDTKTVYDDNTKTNVTVDVNNAIPVYDKATGDLIKYGTYDYSTDNGKTWVKNMQSIIVTDYASSAAKYNKGFTDEEIANITKDFTAEQLNNFVTRDCHVFTLAEAVANGNIAASHKNEKTGLYDYIYLKTNSTTKESLQYNKIFGIAQKQDYYMYRYDTFIGLVSMRGPVDGLYIPAGKVTVPGNKSLYVQLFQYDGQTEIAAGRYDVNVACYSSSKTGGIGEKMNSGKPCTLIVADTSSKAQVSESYKDLSNLLANYEASDFTDYANGASAQQNNARQALITALQAEAAVLNDVTAAQLSDNQQVQAITADSNKNYGDPAYIPFDTSMTDSMPKDVLAVAYEGDDGYYYYDEAQTIRIYTNQALAEIKNFDASGNTEYDDVYFEDGKWYNGYDGDEVIPVTEYGVTTFHVPNTVKYVQEWDASGSIYSYPWLMDTDKQAVNSKNEKLYNQVQFVYRDENGNKVTSKDNWVCKFAETSLRMIPNTGDGVDNRGLYTQTRDMLAYTIEQTKAKISSASAEQLYNDVTLVRTGLNNNNFEVVTFNKMVDAAQAAEANYSIILTYVDSKTKEEVRESYKPTDGIKKMDKLDADKIAYSMEIESELSAVQCNEYKRLFDFYMSKVIERGYIGDSLEAEIVCASGNTWDKLAATPATYDDEGNVVTPAEVRANGAVTADYGKFVNGVLVNEGETVYSTQTWDAYVTALADAVDLAKTGNVNYAHPSSNYFDFATYANEDTNDYTAQVSKCYATDTALQRAEIALTPAESVTVTVVDTEGAAVTVDGTAVTAPVAYQKGETITIDVQYANGYESVGYILINGDKKFVELPYSLYLEEDVTIEAPAEKLAPTGVTVSGSIVVATNPYGATSSKTAYGEYVIDVYSDADMTNYVDTAVSTCTVEDAAVSNTFSILLPAGTYYAEITGPTAIARTVTIIVGANDVDAGEIPMVSCDFRTDGSIDVSDTMAISAEAAVGNTNLVYDLNADGSIDVSDTMITKLCASDVVTYPELTIE